MKHIAILLTVATLTFSAQSHAEGWFDSLKSMFGMSEEAEETVPTTSAMVGSLIENLNVDSSQAEGGLGSLFNYVKGNLTADKFSQLSETLPGINELISAAPDVSELKSTDGLGSLLDKAAEYNDSVKAINEVKKQFEALGLKPEMIMQYVEQAKAYLDTEEGKQAKDLLMQGFGNLMGQTGN
ncbi:DUF2780 domain-containing protein [Aliiglaciecola lipolytica]|uniref:DUF2780 domain-containing protein n=1 Tax=Aliiglaciecola lipolytica TaxID=477689 RepID=UPI001C09087F|nr:DUF2780 domain-containing protein [Aliiglaciecola lipolytica]MBU2876478.1 DUF2780 domain-containing protein [Aliiglaciecola lipolytica]